MPLGMEVGLGPGDTVLDGDPSPPAEGGTAAPPTFRPMSVVAKQSPISATAELRLCVFFAGHTVNEIDENCQQMSRRWIVRTGRNVSDW